jgi:cytidine deaminase
VPISRKKLAASLSKMPRIAAAVQAIVQARQFHGVIDVAEAAALAKSLGTPVDQLALGLVEVAKLYAVTPVSRYNVGAVAVGRSGALYFGANLEVAGQALGVTVHAEQAAVANAWVNGERGLVTLAISAAPCGHCRQFLNELADAATLTIKLPTTSESLTGLLPDAFGPGDLGKSGGLMQTRKRRLAVARRLDAVGAAALEAADASYSPYTKTFAGVALKTRNGVICTGRYAENAAYNPSMSPLQAALSQLVLHGQPFSSIIRAVLVQAPGRASQVDATKAVLRSICRAPLAVYEAT